MIVEKAYSELLVFDSGVLILTLNNSYVGEEMLGELGQEIEDKNQSVQDLFEGFE